MRSFDCLYNTKVVRRTDHRPHAISGTIILKVFGFLMFESKKSQYVIDIGLLESKSLLQVVLWPADFASTQVISDSHSYEHSVCCLTQVDTTEMRRRRNSISNPSIFDGFLSHFVLKLYTAECIFQTFFSLLECGKVEYLVKNPAAHFIAKTFLTFLLKFGICYITTGLGCSLGTGIVFFRGFDYSFVLRTIVFANIQQCFYTLFNYKCFMPNPFMLNLYSISAVLLAPWSKMFYEFTGAVIEVIYDTLALKFYLIVETKWRFRSCQLINESF
ncbi:hypothetical protein BY458DRAFT_488076 [Sporodiniella umbellata]|nr:hypothetical protein BY458DRAFT_488076 [Sporodiniella umbellata]